MAAPGRPLRSRSSRRARRSIPLSPLAPWVEQLEELQLLSATPLISPAQLTPERRGPGSPGGGGGGGITNPTPYGYTPAEIKTAYGINQVTFGGTSGTGAGQTIAIVDAYEDPNIASDLQKFDTQFNLAAPPSFGVAIESGATENTGWALETSLDVESAHAIAPGANILLVEANNSSLTSLLAAVSYAADQPGVSVVSMSWGGSEFSTESSYDSYFTTPSGHAPVTFVASAGDGGAGTTWPAVSPNVLAVGGTTLTTGSGGAYGGETAWSDSGGGYSTYESEPTFQDSVQASGHRSVPDVAFDANPETGVAVYDSVSYAGESGWFEVGGTSVGAPSWSGLIAIADQGRALNLESPLQNGQADIYSLPASDFHDIVSGSNGEYSAGPGYDVVTGRGSPIANLLVPALVGTSSSTPATTLQTETNTQPTRQHNSHSGDRADELPPAEFLASWLQSDPSMVLPQATTEVSPAIVLFAPNDAGKMAAAQQYLIPNVSLNAGLLDALTAGSTVPGTSLAATQAAAPSHDTPLAWNTLALGPVWFPVSESQSMQVTRGEDRLSAAASANGSDAWRSDDWEADAFSSTEDDPLAAIDACFMQDVWVADLNDSTPNGGEPQKSSVPAALAVAMLSGWVWSRTRSSQRKPRNSVSTGG